jgi:hypothetical protein
MGQTVCNCLAIGLFQANVDIHKNVPLDHPLNVTFEGLYSSSLEKF